MKMIIILSLLMSFFYFPLTINAQEIISTNIIFSYKDSGGGERFPEYQTNISFTFEGSDFNNFTGSSNAYLIFSETPDFDLTSGRSFYTHALGRLNKLDHHWSVARPNIQQLKLTPILTGHKISISPANPPIPDGKYYMSILIATTYRIKKEDGTEIRKSVIIPVKEKNNKSIYMGNPPVNLCDIQISDLKHFESSVYEGSSVNVTFTTKVTEGNNVKFITDARLKLNNGDVVKHFNQREAFTLSAGNSETRTISLFIPVGVTASYNTISFFIELYVTQINSNHRDKNSTNDSKTVPITIRSNAYRSSYELGDTQDHLTIKNGSAINQEYHNKVLIKWNSPQQSGLKVTIPKELIGRKIFIVNVTNGGITTVIRTIQSEFEVPLSHSLRKMDVISVYVEGDNNSKKLLKTR
ncbi:MAG: hypothetical protein VB024_09190 [Dysgonamonadaceae bacterium]|jgi:hypothetical protein|nr:hypothetical protein [Dysgonamonadaceae bacterium]